MRNEGGGWGTGRGRPRVFSCLSYYTIDHASSRGWVRGRGRFDVKRDDGKHQIKNRTLHTIGARDTATPRRPTKKKTCASRVSEHALRQQLRS